jgi:hypothetical protein
VRRNRTQPKPPLQKLRGRQLEQTPVLTGTGSSEAKSAPTQATPLYASANWVTPGSSNSACDVCNFAWGFMFWVQLLKLAFRFEFLPTPVLLEILTRKHWFNGVVLILIPPGDRRFEISETLLTSKSTRKHHGIYNLDYHKDYWWVLQFVCLYFAIAWFCRALIQLATLAYVYISGVLNIGPRSLRHREGASANPWQAQSALAPSVTARERALTPDRPIRTTGGPFHPLESRTECQF